MGKPLGSVALILTLVLGAATTCCRPSKPPIVRPYPAPTVESLRGALEAHQLAVRSMNARVRATSWIGGERLRATVLMLVERAGRLRFEAEVSLQGTVSILVSDGARFAMLDLQKNELRRGPACPANVASLIRIPLLPAEVAALLLGDVVIGGGGKETSSQVLWDAGQGADVLTVTHADGTRTLLAFRHQGNADELSGVTREGLAGRLWRVSFEEMETVTGTRMPGLIRFAEGQQSFDEGVEIKFKDRAVNATASPTDFTLAPPPGTTTIEVGCGA
ncbi:MAG TPA: hypothetical protein VFH73_05920 [Polyangia bacterium]|nr:hypothetical protein [Polyangia bacterium]